MANTSTISQMAAQVRLNQPTNQPANTAQSDGESFRDLMNQAKDVSGTEEPSDPVGKQDKTEETGNHLEGTVSSFVLQSMVGELLVSQEPAVPVLDITAPTQTAAVSGLPDMDTQEPDTDATASVQNPLVTMPADKAAAELVQGQALAGEQKLVTDKANVDAGKTPVVEKQTESSQPLQTVPLSEDAAAVPVQDKQSGNLGGTTEDAAASQQKSLSQTELSGNVVVKEEVKTETKPEDATMLSDLQPKEVKTEKAEIIRIKVAEPFRQVTPDVMNQISGSIKEQAMLGREELVIQLEPEHLGKIAIKISMEDSGVKVILNCESAKTQSLLAEKAAGIGRIVEDNLNRPVIVEMKEEGYWNQQKDATDQHASQNQRQQEQTEKQSIEDTELFIQQLRLGLSPRQTFAV